MKKKHLAPQTTDMTLPHLVDELNAILLEIEQKHWKPQHQHYLKTLLGELQQFIQPLEQILVEELIQKINDTLDNDLQTQPPSEKALAVIHSYITKLQEVITVNVMGEQGKLLEETISPYHTLIIGLKDKHLAAEITQQVKYFGYHCIVCHSLEAVLESVRHSMDYQLGAIILDTDFSPNQDPIPLQPVGSKIPLIFISKNQDVATRLFAVKSGGQAFFVLPLEFASLIEKIDDVITPVNKSPPYRILVIEDSDTQASVIRKDLEKSGMIVEILTEPYYINDILMEFQPDLILLDLYMPTCSGIELARVIRQQDAFMSIPIVYLSAENDINKQLIAIKGGADDFLTKTIAPNHLVAAVTARAERSRTLRAQMIQDSLTGLLNHTRILEQLELEIARAKRNQTALSFAMLDIDHFKMINDYYGHPVGDRVIKGLARLLKQRLRKVDSIGRYGGEEFAIILPQTDNRLVAKKLDDIRRGFSKLLHRVSSPPIEFSATFSIGLAQYSPTMNSVDKLVQAADKALYDAKEQGRNIIVVYPESSR